MSINACWHVANSFILNFFTAVMAKTARLCACSGQHSRVIHCSVRFRLRFVVSKSGCISLHQGDGSSLPIMGLLTSMCCHCRHHPLWVPCSPLCIAIKELVCSGNCGMLPFFQTSACSLGPIAVLHFASTCIAYPILTLSCWPAHSI